jgi:hypothetical protein
VTGESSMEAHGGMSTATSETGSRMLLIDAANVVGSRPNGWWKVRAGAARLLIDQLQQARRNDLLPGPVVVVLEGQARKGWDEGVADGVRVVHASGEGDDTIAQVAAEAPDPVILVSADRGLAQRVRRTGAEVVGPRWLLDKLDAP